MHLSASIVGDVFQRQLNEWLPGSASQFHVSSRLRLSDLSVLPGLDCALHGSCCLLLAVRLSSQAYVRPRDVGTHFFAAGAHGLRQTCLGLVDGSVCWFVFESGKSLTKAAVAADLTRRGGRGVVLQHSG